MNNWLVVKQKLLSIVPTGDTDFLSNWDQLRDLKGQTMTVGEARALLAALKPITFGDSMIYLNQVVEVINTFNETNAKTELLKKKVINHYIAESIAQTFNKVLVSQGMYDLIPEDFNTMTQRIEHLYGSTCIGRLAAATVFLINRFETNIGKFMVVLRKYDEWAGQPKILSIKSTQGNLSVTQFLDRYQNLIDNKNYASIPDVDYIGDKDSGLKGTDTEFKIIYHVALLNGINFIYVDKNQQGFNTTDGRIQNFNDIRLITISHERLGDRIL